MRRSEMVDKLAMMLGGRTAEELVFSDPTTGASHDIKQATDLARKMGEAGSRTVDEFDRDAMVRDQEDLYRNLLETKGVTVSEEVQWTGR